jgi:acyl-CoA synthetase (NDP forming)
MTTCSPMHRLLHPRSIAVIGASSDAQKFSGRPLAYLRKLNYAGRVFPINPTATTIQGYQCFKDIADVQETVDVVIVARPAVEVVSEVKKCIRLGIRAFVVFSAGFAEEGPNGAALQERLTAICVDADAVLIGPNSTGLFSIPDHAAMSFMSNLDVDATSAGSVALVSCSGSIATMIYQGQSNVFNLVASTGNEAVLTSSRIIGQTIEDPGTRGAVAYIEGIRDAPRLIETAKRARDLGKLIAVLKVGRSQVAADMAASHTGALVNDDIVVDAVFRRHGIIRLESIADLRVASALIHAGIASIAGQGVGVVTASGGTAALVTDLMAAHRITLPAFAEVTLAQLKAVLPMAAAANPMDVTGFADARVFGKVMGIVLDDAGIDVLLVPLGGAVGVNALHRAEAVVALAKDSAKLIIAIWQSTTRDQPGYDLLVSSGVPVFTDYEVVCRVIARVLKQRGRQRVIDTTLAAQVTAIDVSRLEKIVTDEGCHRTLNEAAGKAVLALAGISIPDAVLYPGVFGAADCAGKQFPAVLKVVSADIIHKTVVGGVCVVRTPEEAARAVSEMDHNVRLNAPEATIDGYILEEMILGGTELLIGVRRDSVFGLTVTLAIGGVLANAFENAVTSVLPLDHRAAVELVEDFSPMLATEARGEVLVDVLLRVASIVRVLGDRLTLIEINPIKLVGDGDSVRAVALDAVIEL